MLLSCLLGRLAARLAPAGSRERASFITFSLGVGSPCLFRLCTYGLETGIYLVMVALVVLRSLAVPHRGQRDHAAIGLGVLAGLTALARIDFGIIFAVVVGLLLAFGRVSWRWVAACGLAASLFVAPWLVWMYLVSGSPIPSSGLAQGGVAIGPILLRRVARMAGALIQDVTPWSHTEGRLPLTLLTVGEWALVGAVLVGRRQRLPRLLSPPIRGVTLAWLVGVAALIPIYTVLFWSSHFYARYMAPLTVLAFPIIGSGLAGLFAPARSRLCVGLVYVGMLASFFLHAATSLHTGHIGNTHVLAAGFVQGHFAGRRVGAFQSGVIGYFNENVLNLDGKVNSDALWARRSGTLVEYLDRARVDVLIDWPEVLRANLESGYLRDRWVPCEVQPPLGQSLCLRRRDGIGSRGW